MTKPLIQAVFFDLDGTLLDSALDLVWGVNQILIKYQRPPCPYEQLRTAAAHGSAILIESGFNETPDHPDFEKWRLDFLDLYKKNLFNRSKLFTGIPPLLDFLAEKKVSWGIVTNKPAWLTDPLIKQIPFAYPPAVVVSGDTCKNPKPHPESLLFACQQISVNAQNCLYIGDAQRDIEAGKAAGMKTILARYGYIEETAHPEQWGANLIIKESTEFVENLRGLL